MTTFGKQTETVSPTNTCPDSFELQIDFLNSTTDSGRKSMARDSKLTRSTSNFESNVWKSKLFIGTVMCSAFFITTLCIAILVHYEMDNEVVSAKDIPYWNVDLPKEQSIWYDSALNELKEALHRKLNERRARNVILFVGDGMGPNTVTASRIYGFKEEDYLIWEKFPHMGMLKTYCANKQVPDSFSTATALFGGVKVNYETGGVDSTVNLGNCSASSDSSHHVQSLLQWAQVDGMNTGFVTTTRITHATPAALYAHVPDRRWECEAKMPIKAKENGCKDIARILIEDEPGKNINVIMGGGRQCLVTGVKNSTADPIDKWACLSNDGRDLIQDWKKRKEQLGVSYAVVQNNGELNALNGKNIKYLLGVFSNGHLKYDNERDRSENGMPSLKEMTLKALEVLKSKNKGFFLMVEGGMIDQAHHRGTARKALNEVIALNDAVNATIYDMKEQLDETLIIVTADHSHTLTINGYPERGNNILGVASKSKTEGTPYTTLTYGTSYKGFKIDENKKRIDPTHQNTVDWEYTQQAAINTDENTHGGSDVTIHATGPMSHLFHRVHEQSYVAHAISFALRIGRFRDSAIVESLAELLPF